MTKNKSVLIVVTSHDSFQGGKTGVWLSEFAEAYYEFTKRDYKVTVASPLGGKGPFDPTSIDENTSQDLLDAEIYLEKTIPLDEVTTEDYDAVFFPGGYGAMFDLPDNIKLQGLLRHSVDNNKPDALFVKNH
ncbi:DJ-1/PfpI family protein [Lentibacillus sediminis]|uniref:DJ-1/PfpI family protein n=1 Tax=Lentibacillus sediminis TaxID=1940529 RepID=UPI000C1C0494|nr:DJ-1/PfpI family protein [Lentibacillus sediminis]